jgi:hypothetical protein
MATEEKTNQETTSIEQVEMNLDEILGTPGAENVMLPETEKKPNVFTKETTDLSFLNEDSDEEGSESKQESKPEEVAASVLKELDQEMLGQPGDDEEESDSKKTAGRPKLDKSGTSELFKKLIDKGQIVPFDDDKPLEEYTIKDFEELLEANIADRENQIRETTPVEFFDSLPEELQVAAKYVADGGEDLKGLFRILSEVEEHRQLNPKDSKDQEQIVREYLRATNFGTEDEIDEEIYSWKDRGDLESKALKFKPKLDKMQEQVVAQKLAQQENMRKQQQQAAQAYMQNVYTTLNTGEINGIKLDKKTQGMLYTGLVQPGYPSISGKQTNMLGHLLEKYQYVEPRHDLIAEALWLLADPDGYKSKIKEQGKNAAVEKTVRQLKTEQAKMATSTPVVEQEETTQRRIPRGGNFFKR